MNQLLYLKLHIGIYNVKTTLSYDTTTLNNNGEIIFSKKKIRNDDTILSTQVNIKTLSNDGTILVNFNNMPDIF